MNVCVRWCGGVFPGFCRMVCVGVCGSVFAQFCWILPVSVCVYECVCVCVVVCVGGAFASLPDGV